MASRMAMLHRRVPLRVTLVAALLLLVAVALVASGVATRATLQHYLVTRVDEQLRGAAHQVAERGLQDPSHPPPGRDADDRGPLPSAFVAEVLDADGSAVYGPASNLLDTGEPLPKLPHLTAHGDRKQPSSFTVPAVSGGGQWRVRAVPVTLENGGSGTLLVAQSLGEVQSTLDRLLLLLLVIGAVTVLVLGGIGYVVVRTSLRPLEKVEQTAAAIAGGDLTQRVPASDPRTEVGQLAGALNTMLAQIESAFANSAESEEEARLSEDRMRRFVADASHELRTPLTSIRGFAELYRQGAVTGEGDVRRLLGRIEEEAARMGLLVEDLLLLAQLDEQRPLAQEPVDLLDLAAASVESARAMQPQRPVRLEIGGLTSPPVVVGDEARLRQALDNLVTNALRHTPAETPVTVSVVSVQDRKDGASCVVLEVADEGPGLDARHAARVFERFYRVDASRTRVGGGTGLGLAITASLVRAHGGQVTVDTAPGRGARFRVELPAADVAFAAEAQPVWEHAGNGHARAK